ncbi:MAG: hypothetical protein AB1546_07930 [bacterium]
MRFFLNYTAGPYEAVKRHVVKIGTTAIPIVVDEMINYKNPDREYREKRIRQDGVEIIEKITGKNFNNDREKVLEWWAKQRKM